MTYRLLIEYDGADFRGWQTQDGHPTVQETLEKALQVALGKRAPIVGSGRTDTGVHARGQVAHFQVEQEIDAPRVLRSLNGLLPPSITVLDLTQALEGFHARYDARRRRYHYYIATMPRALDRRSRVLVRPALDMAAMRAATRHLLGAHHCGAFCRTRSETTNRICEIFVARWVAEQRPGDARFEIEADRFLHGMVRSIVGTLLEVGRGKRREDDLVRILASQDRREAGPAAPAHGLVLEKVTYFDIEHQGMPRG